MVLKWSSPQVVPRQQGGRPVEWFHILPYSGTSAVQGWVCVYYCHDSFHIQFPVQSTRANDLKATDPTRREPPRSWRAQRKDTQLVTEKASWERLDWD